MPFLLTKSQSSAQDAQEIQYAVTLSGEIYIDDLQANEQTDQLAQRIQAVAGLVTAIGQYLQSPRPGAVDYTANSVLHCAFMGLFPSPLPPSNVPAAPWPEAIKQFNGTTLGKMYSNVTNLLTPAHEACVQTDNFGDYYLNFKRFVADVLSLDFGDTSTNPGIFNFFYNNLYQCAGSGPAWVSATATSSNTSDFWHLYCNSLNQALQLSMPDFTIRNPTAMACFWDLLETYCEQDPTDQKPYGFTLSDFMLFMLYTISCSIRYGDGNTWVWGTDDDKIQAVGFLATSAQVAADRRANAAGSPITPTDVVNVIRELEYLGGAPMAEQFPVPVVANVATLAIGMMLSPLS